MLFHATTWAYSFEVDGIFYNITSSTGLTVEITYEAYAKTTATYDGDFVIPESVDYDGNTYAVTGIGDDAFEYSTIKTVSIPETITKIGSYAFSDCSIEEVVIPNTVTSLGWDAFEYCASLKSAVIGDGVTTLDTYTFSNAKALETVVLGKSITKIAMSAFYNCISLKEITIPEAVTSIGSNSFGLCTALEAVTSLNPTPPSCSSNSFASVDTDNCVLYVPTGCVEDYAADQYWGAFANILEVDSSTTGIGGATIGSQGEATIYTIDGQRVSAPAKGGIYVVNGKKVVLK